MFILVTDASNKAIGATLSQRDVFNKESIISFYSKTLTETQQNYSRTEKELLAILMSLKKFKHLLLGKSFILKTDHKPLTFMLKTKNINSRVMRWSLEIQEYDFKIEYLKGNENYTDIISRPVEDENLLVSNIMKEFRKARLIMVNDDNDKKSLIDEYHKESGHSGIRSMKHLLCKKYIWKNMSKEIDNYVKTCETCGRSLPRKRQKEFYHNRAERENEKWQIDLIGPFKTSQNGYKYILNCLDTFTRYLYTQPIRNKTSKEIKRALTDILGVEKIIPEIITSDNGLEFKNSEILDFAKNNNIV